MGTSANGYGRAVLRPCNSQDDRQRWHGANRDTSATDQVCCSGVRAWNTDQCVFGVDGDGAVKTFVCDISGRNQRQIWEMSEEGQLRRKVGGFMSSQCLLPDGHSGNIAAKTCPGTGSAAQWSKDDPSEPIESQLYRKAMYEGEA